MEDVVVGELGDPRGKFAQDRAERAVVESIGAEEFEQLAGHLHPGRGRQVARHQLVAGIAHRLVEPPAGQDVVTDVDHPVGRQVFPADPQHRFAHGFGHPAVDAVADDVVEFAEFRADVGDAHAVDLDVVEAEPFDPGLAVGDLALADVDADELRLREEGGMGNEVAARGAAELEHPRGLDRRRFEPEQLRERGQPRGVRLGERVGAVGQIVVLRGDAVDGFLQQRAGRR